MDEASSMVSIFSRENRSWWLRSRSSSLFGCHQAGGRGAYVVLLRPGVPSPLRSSLELSLERVATGVWVEHHRGSTRRQCAGESRAPGRIFNVVRRSA